MNVPPEVSRAVEAREKIVEALALQDSVRLRMVVKSAAQTQWSNQSLAASGLPVVFRDPVLAHQLDGATQALTQGALQKWRSAYSGSHRSLGHPFAGQTGTTFLQQVSELEGWLRSVDSVQQEVPTRVYRALAFKLAPLWSCPSPSGAAGRRSRSRSRSPRPRPPQPQPQPAPARIAAAAARRRSRWRQPQAQSAKWNRAVREAAVVRARLSALIQSRPRWKCNIGASRSLSPKCKGSVQGFTCSRTSWQCASLDHSRGEGHV